jgi:hypothetical protein
MEILRWHAAFDSRDDLENGQIDEKGGPSHLGM